MSSHLRQQRKAVSPTSPAHQSLEHDHPDEEPKKSPHTILEQQIQQAQEELERPASGLLLSGLSAGLDLGFGPFLMAMILTLGKHELSPAVMDLLLAGAYSVGFIFVVLGRSVLFTEQTTSAVLPVLGKRAGVSRLMRLWGIVLVANVAGATLIGVLIAHLGPRLGIVSGAAMAEIAATLLRPSSPTMFLSAVVAGWLMGLLTWLVVAGRDTTSQILIVAVTTFVIGIGGFHHSIAGSTEVLMAVFSGVGPTLTDFGRFLFWAVVGNAIGGIVFVAMLKFGAVRGSTEPHRPG